MPNNSKGLAKGAYRPIKYQYASREDEQISTWENERKTWKAIE